MNAADQQGTAIDIDAVEANTLRWRLIRLLRCSVDGTGIDEEIVGNMRHSVRLTDAGRRDVVYDRVVA